MHVVFDLDGVLLDSESDLSWLEDALSAIIESVGLADSADNRAALFPSSMDRLERLADEAGVTSHHLWAVRNRHYTEAKVAAIESGTIGPYEDLEAVYDLTTAYDLGIISNSPQTVVETFVSHVGMDGVFQPMVGRGTAIEDVERKKPHPYLFERLHEQTATEQYVYVGDRATDREFADKAGMDFICLDREDGPTRSLYDVRDLIVDP